MIDFILLHLDFIAMVFVILGYFRMGSLKIDGWLWTCLGGILLVIFGIWIVPDAIGIAIGNAIFVVLMIRGFINWRKNLNRGFK